jgi:subtilisin family serine protease
MLTGGHRLARLAAAGILTLTVLASVTVGTSAPVVADTVRNAQMWVLNALNAQAAWAVTQGKGVTVAVIDSGVNAHVSDLAGSVITGPDFTGVSTPPSNPYWGVHGTWMASLIAGHGHGGGTSGILGVAPQARILSLRVVTDRHDPGYARYQGEPDARVQKALADAVGYAVAHGASVISMSLGYGAPSAVVRAALQQALSHGVVVVASSGNSGERVGGRPRGQAPYSFPADYPGVLGVAAIAQDGSTANFSSDNLSVQVAAPGVNVPAQGRDGQYWLVSGTSPACALTAGVAALVKARYPHLAAPLVIRAITASTRNRPPGGYNDKVGFGTVDAAAALSTAADLTGLMRATSGDLASARFGSNAPIPPVPVAPRGAAGLVISCILSMVFLAAALTSWSLLRRARRAGRRDYRAGQPAPVWPGPSVDATWPGTADHGWQGTSENGRPVTREDGRPGRQHDP